MREPADVDVLACSLRVLAGETRLPWGLARHRPRPLQQNVLGVNLPSPASSVNPSYRLRCQGRLWVSIDALTPWSAGRSRAQGSSGLFGATQSCFTLAA